MKVPEFLKNKYYLTLCVFGAYMLFFNDADVFSVVSYHQELNKLDKEIVWYNKQTEASQERLEQLNEGGFALEKLAREKHNLKKENEDVFIISTHN